jgi:hypothetical protein
VTRRRSKDKRSAEVAMRKRDEWINVWGTDRVEETRELMMMMMEEKGKCWLTRTMEEQKESDWIEANGTKSKNHS